MSAPDRLPGSSDQWPHFKRGPTRGTELLQLPLEERQRIARLEHVRATALRAFFGGPTAKRRTIHPAALKKGRSKLTTSRSLSDETPAQAIERRRREHLAEAAPPLDPSRADTESAAARVKAAAESGFDPLAEQVQTNLDRVADSHPTPAPTIVNVDLAEDERERQREALTGRVEVSQRGHLGPAQ